MPESLTIDFADRDDVRAKLPQARRMLEHKERALNEAREDWEDWRAFVQMLERRAGVAETPEKEVSDGKIRVAPSETLPTPEPPAGAAKEAQPLDLVVEVLNRENRKIRAQDVAEILRREGHDLPKVTVSNALFYAAKRAKPPRAKQALGRGYYAPLSYTEPSMITASAEAEGHGSAHLTTPAILRASTDHQVRADGEGE